MSKQAQRIVSRLAVIAIIAGTTPQAFAQAPAPTEMIAAQWLQWRVFHASLQHYAAEDPTAVARMLSLRFGIMSNGARAIQEAGKAYLSNLVEIDEEAKAIIRARYGAAGRTGGPAEVPIELQPGKTLLQMVKADGLYATIEQRKALALQSHFTVLRAAVGADTLARLQLWCQTAVGPRVRTFDQGTRVPAPPVPPAGGIGPAWSPSAPKGR